MTSYELYLQQKQGGNQPQTSYERYLAAKQAAGGASDSPPSSQAVTATPPTNKPLLTGIPAYDVGKTLTGWASKAANKGIETLIEPAISSLRAEQEQAGPGMGRLGARATETGYGVGRFFASAPDFANRFVNPEEYGSTAGEQGKEAIGGLWQGIKQFPAQVGEGVRMAAEDIDAAYGDPTMKQPNITEGLYRGLGADSTYQQAVEAYRADPSAPINTALMVTGGIKGGLGAVRKAGKVVRGLRDTRQPVNMIDNAPVFGATEKSIGYNTHGRWASAKEIYDLEKERGNLESFDETDIAKIESLLTPENEAIWVTRKPEDAVRYLRDADEWDAGRPVTQEELNNIGEIDLRKARHIRELDDGDGGELWVRPRDNASAITPAPPENLAANPAEMARFTAEQPISPVASIQDIGTTNPSQTVYHGSPYDNITEFNTRRRDLEGAQRSIEASTAEPVLNQQFPPMGTAVAPEQSLVSEKVRPTSTVGTTETGTAIPTIKEFGDKIQSYRDQIAAAQTNFGVRRSPYSPKGGSSLTYEIFTGEGGSTIVGSFTARRNLTERGLRTLANRRMTELLKAYDQKLFNAESLSLAYDKFYGTKRPNPPEIPNVDKVNATRPPSGIEQGQAIEQAQPVTRPIGEATSANRVFQEQEAVAKPLGVKSGAFYEFFDENAKGASEITGKPIQKLRDGRITVGIPYHEAGKWEGKLSFSDKSAPVPPKVQAPPAAKQPDLASKSAVPEVKPAAKQPWEMKGELSNKETWQLAKADYLKESPIEINGGVRTPTPKEYSDFINDEGSRGGDARAALVNRYRSHAFQVKHALSSGLPVSASVLAEYGLEGKGKPETPPTVPPEVPPVEPKPVETNPGGETNVSTLAIRTEADAIEAKLTKDFGDLPEYKTMDMREQANRAQSLIDLDYEKAKRVAMGDETPPAGLREASVYEGVKLRALKDGDSELLRRLAVESTVPQKLSAYGQAIKAADSDLMSDPVRVMQDISKVRQEYAQRTGMKYSARVIADLKQRLSSAETALAKRVTTTTKRVYGARNRIVSTDSYLAAKAAIRASLSTAHSGIPPGLVVDLTRIGTYHLEAGTRLFADWSVRMIEDIGERVRPHLDELWKKIQDDKRVQIALRSQKTRLANEAVKYGEKLAGLDFTKPEHRTLIFDPEARRLKAVRDAAKRNYESALNAFPSVTKDEAANIVKLSDRMTTKLGEMEKGGDRLEYGAARVAYENYVNDLKGENAPIRTLVKAGIDKFKTTAATNKAKAVFDLGTDALKTVVNNSVSMVATLDNSFLGRQGLHTLMTHPTVWAKGAVNSFVDIWNTLGGKNAHDALMADIYSRPNYIDGSYQKAGILAKVEEQFPSSLPERIPVVGRVFKASEYAFTGSAIRMRTGLYDLLAKRAVENGVSMTDPIQVKSLGKMINALTARGQWGQRGEPAIVRLVMWAPKMLKGNIDVLTVHGGGVGLESSFARKQAAINLLKVVGETATLMTIANALKPGSAETDPRSSDFGKIKIGNTRFDITGGAASIVTLASRIITRERKSTNTGEIIPYGIKYGQASPMDALVDFMANKTNPPTHVVVDWLRGKDYRGQPFSLGGSVFRATTPIIVQQAISLKDDASANAVAGVILDGFGINAQTYQPYKDSEAATRVKIREMLDKGNKEGARTLQKQWNDANPINKISKVETTVEMQKAAAAKAKHDAEILEKAKKSKPQSAAPIELPDLYGLEHLDSIPANLTVRVNVIHADTGKRVEVKRNARQTVKSLNEQLAAYKKVYKDVTGEEWA